MTKRRTPRRFFPCKDGQDRACLVVEIKATREVVESIEAIAKHNDMTVNMFLRFCLDQGLDIQREQFEEETG